MNQKMIRVLANRHYDLCHQSPIPPSGEDYEEMADIRTALAEYMAGSGKDTNGGNIVATLIDGAEYIGDVFNDSDLTRLALRTALRESGLAAMAKLYLALDAITDGCFEHRLEELCNV